MRRRKKKSKTVTITLHGTIPDAGTLVLTPDVVQYGWPFAVKVLWRRAP